MDLTRLELPQPIYGSVNVYRVGNTLIDTGHLAESRALQSELDGGELDGIERVVLTHAHSDHIGGTETLESVAKLPHTVYTGVEDIIHNYNSYLDRVHEQLRDRGAGLDTSVETILDSYFPKGEYTEQSIHVDRLVAEGETVTLGEDDCEVIHTPGHAQQHMALFHEESGTMFSGDLISPSGYFNLGPIYSDVDAYERSLRKLRDFDVDRFAPGHGPIMEDPEARLTDAIKKNEQSRATIREAVRESDGSISAQTLAREALGAAPASVPFLTFVVCQYLDALAAEGVIEMANTDKGVYARPKNGKQ
jgi:glyoxylase-like metal-dependent hydrolase (beta-lactamase superfamily II)